MLLVGTLLPLLGGVFLLASRNTLDFSRPSTWLGLAGASGGWLLALWLGRGARDSSAMGAAIAAGAVALRLCFLAGEPELSDDIHRYVWEGGLLRAGVDPYALAPASAELAPYQESWQATFERVNHPRVSAAYPPLAQAVNAGLVAAAGGAEHGARSRGFLRAFYALCDLLVCWPLLHLLRRLRLPLACGVAWAWNPWVALEFAGSGHLDALAILCLVGALACLEGGAASSGLALLAAGTATKLLPVALVPFALRGSPRPARAALAFAAGLALCSVPFVLLAHAWPRPGGLGEYAFRWESFSLLYRWIEPRFAAHHAYDESWSDPRRLARGLVLLLWLGLALVAWRRRLDLVRSAGLLIGGFLVLTPTLHPWYLAWMVPFLALRPSLAWSALAAAAPLLYWPVQRWRSEGVWQEPGWLWPVLAGPFLVLLALELARALRRERR